MASFDWGALMEKSGGDFEIIPNGQYAASVTKCEPKTSKNGKLMFMTTFKIIAGNHTGRTIINNIVLSPENPNAVRAFFINLQNLGVGPEFLKQTPAPEPAQIAAKMVGAQAIIEVGQHEYQGSTRNDVNRISRMSEQARQKLMMNQTTGGVAVPRMAAPAPAPAVPMTPTAAADPWAGSQNDAGKMMGQSEESTIPIPEPKNPAPAEETSAPQEAPVTPTAPSLPSFADIQF